MTMHGENTGQPDARNAAVLVGTSEFDRFWLAKIRQEVHESWLTFINLAGVPPDQLPTKVAAFSLDTIVFFQLIPEEAKQTELETYELLAAT